MILKIVGEPIKHGAKRWFGNQSNIYNMKDGLETAQAWNMIWRPHKYGVNRWLGN